MMSKMNRMSALTLAAGFAIATGARGQEVDDPKFYLCGTADPIAEVSMVIEVTKPVEAAHPVIEVVFVLDTTGSMGGLIEGAKQKIWSIANAIATAKPTPDIKIGLVGYRDRGDEYVTVRTTMTSDLDAIYSDLMKYQAGGGGDGPESVNQAIHEAVTGFGWSEDANALKLVYLVGDAPPHMDYENDVKYHDSCASAAEAGIIINTIQCGTMGGTDKVWQEIARLSEGEYFAIGQDGGMVAVATPYDAEVVQLGIDLDETLIGYGDAQEQDAFYSKREAGLRIDELASSSSNADRARYKAGEAGLDSLTGRQELVRDIEEGKANLEDIDEKDLPEIMQKMTVEQRVVYVNEQQIKRSQLRLQINEIDLKRQAFIKDALGKQADGFDQKVLESLRKQAAKNGIVYEVPDGENPKGPDNDPESEAGEKPENESGEKEAKDGSEKKVKKDDK